MYSWKTLSRLGLVLLTLPLLHLVYLAWSGYAALRDPSPEVWDDQLQAIIDADRRQQLPESPVIVVGGHTVRLWKDLPDNLGERPTLLRPLGGATIGDLTHHYNRLIGFYRPSVLIVVPSYAELYLRKKKTPAALAEALAVLLERNAAIGITSRRYIVIPPKTLLHPRDSERIDALTAAARAVARTLPLTEVLDPNPALATASGAPNPDYFTTDGINLNPEGYAVLSAMVRKQLIEDRLINASS